MKKTVVTIDGPAGAGKSTVARTLAGELGYVYVDTGALYRGVAYEIRNRAVDTGDKQALCEFLNHLSFDCHMENQSFRLFSSGRDISEKIRTPEISMLASRVSAIREVRSALLGIQKQIAKTHDSVFEGRDMGTEVFPSADCKFYLTADLSVRAGRRYQEDAGSAQSFEDVKKEMEKRDMDDAHRSFAPLKIPSDSLVVDSTGLTVEEVVKKMYNFIMNSSCL